jgi:hypothetical protein
MRADRALLVLSLLCACRGFDPPGGGAAASNCCAGAGSCVPAALAPAGLGERLAQDSCADSLLCAPTAWLNDAEAQAASCQTLDEREGRCLPGCLPELARQAERLSQASCGAGELCVPCFDPLTGEDTQACRIGRDRPAEKARPFEACCGGEGRCVPETTLSSSLSRAELERLDADACETAALCVPETWLSADNPGPESCRVAGDMEGRCLPSCLPQVVAQADTLQQQSCADTERCVPCFDPRSGHDTEACRIAGDRPREKPRTFERCCGGSGSCVPEAALLGSLSVEERARLGTAECGEESQALCVPDALLTEEARAPSCRAAGDLEGRCLPSCLPEVARQAERLQQRDCDREQRCVPCYDPITGADTRACRSGKDKPRERARGYERCCGAVGAQLGTCLPVELLSTSQLDALPLDSCRHPGTRCAPSELLDPEPRLATCSVQGLVVASSPGLCLAECFLPTALRFFTPRASCTAPRRCVPCANLGVDQPGCE